ncbi:MAG: hypothetical protein FJ102_03495 [Deltaproteobacteria bacterium]|nr:hypothetical protein [Deltaproteobacteria bacterium]
MSLLKPIVLGSILAFSSAAFAGHRPAVSVHLPAVSVTLGSAGNLWVAAFVDHHGVYHPGYWRPAYRHGWVWVDGYRDRHGHWHAGYWRRR